MDVLSKIRLELPRHRMIFQGPESKLGSGKKLTLDFHMQWPSELGM